MGILLEADYKGILQGKGSIVSGLQRALDSLRFGDQNSLHRSAGENLRTKENDGQLTYELMNRNSGSLVVPEILIQQISELGLTQIWLGSGRSSEGSYTRKCPHLRLHICCRRGSTHPPKIYHNKKGRRSYHIIGISRSARHFRATNFHVRFLT
jgi:hypothetical protein